jgi:hypothetical protein
MTTGHVVKRSKTSKAQRLLRHWKDQETLVLPHAGRRARRQETSTPTETE